VRLRRSSFPSRAENLERRARTEPRPPMISIFVVSGTRLYAELLGYALERREGVEVLGTALDTAGAAARVAQADPDIALVDVSGSESLAGVRAIRSACPRSKIVALAVPEVADVIVKCAEAGIAGYVAREEASLDVLVETLRAVHGGEAPCSPRIAAALLERVSVLAAQSHVEVPTARLTSREYDVAELLRDGLSNKEIASTLHIELSTVKNHMHSILEKLEVRRRGEVIALLGGRAHAA
jgi:two-component system, NarL family, nitrate/nitrite response regulator NarL